MLCNCNWAPRPASISRSASAGLRHDLAASGDIDLLRVKLHDDGNPCIHLARIEQHPYLVDLADRHAAKIDRGADLQPLHRTREVGDVRVALDEPAACLRTPAGRSRSARSRRPRSRRSPLDSLCSCARRLPVRRCRLGTGRECSPPPRVRNVSTFGSGGWASSSCGSPVASWLLVSGSRNTELLAIAKMLGSSWVTMTTVAPRLSRSSRIRSSRRRELIGSSPADGSSKNRTSGSSAMARARPARLRMPPLISDG